MSTGINIAPSSDITVGTTAVTSGTDTRVFFQAGGVVQQDANFTFDNTLKRLTLKAVGTAATDIPFAVQDSAGTTTLLKVQGNQQTVIQSGPFATYTFTQDVNQAATFMLRTTGNSQAELGNDFGAAPGNFYTGALKLYNWSSVLRTRIQAVGTSYWADPTAVVSIGSSTNGARLDVRAQGALSTDIAFRVRNSADTGNVSEFRGNGVGVVCGFGTARAFFSPYNAHGGDGFMMTTQDLAVNGTPTKAAMFMTEGYINMYGTSGVQSLSFAVDATYGGTTRQWQFSNLNLNDGALYLGTGNSATNNRRLFITDSATLNIGKDTMGNVNSGTNQLRILSGTPPSALAADTFALYSADITAGNAAPHFRTEVGDIIKLYKQSSAGIATVGDLVTILTNLGLLG